MVETNYAVSDGISIAYQTRGNGPIDIVIVPGLFSHVELFLEFPEYTDFLDKLAKFARVITFDKRGQGLSEQIDGAPTIEERADDMLKIMAAAGSQKAVLFGNSEGAAMTLLFAALHPGKVSQVITFSGFAKACRAEDYPFMPSYEERSKRTEYWIENWGKGTALGIMAPKLESNDAARRLFGRIERASMTPSSMRKYFEMNLAIDIREILPAVRIPALIMHTEDDRQVSVENAVYLVERLPDAKFVNCGSGGHAFWGADNDKVIAEIEDFVIGKSVRPLGADRVLATVLFTDIADSTAMLAELGDAAWRTLFDRHVAEARDTIELYRGRLIKSTGDGLLATFDGPGRAVQCACRLTDKAAAIGLQIRAGLHSGEVVFSNGDVSGIAVHAAARMEGLAKPGQVIVSQTVTDLTFGSEVVQFEPIGSHNLKGLPGEWALFQARS